METTYKIRFWKIGVYQGKRSTTYYVRWTLDGKQWKEPFENKALAESFRATLMTAARQGEAFDIETGRPISMQRAKKRTTWYEFACAFVDMKWPYVAATTRRTHAEAFTAITVALISAQRGKPEDKTIRRALCRWGFNTNRRNDPDVPKEIRDALSWVQRNTPPVSSLSKSETLRSVLNYLTVRLDGKPAAPSVISRRRKILNTAIE